MDIIQILAKLKELFVLQTLAKDDSREVEIRQCIDDIFTYLSTLNYDAYLAISAKVQGVFDEFNNISIPYLLLVSIDNLNRVERLPSGEDVCLPVIDQDATEQGERLKLLMEQLFQLNMEHLRLSTAKMPDIVGPIKENEALLYLSLKLMGKMDDGPTLSREDERYYFILLILTHGITKHVGLIELFYRAASGFFDRLNYSNEYQLARDTSEEILITSFLDGAPEWGYALQFNVFFLQHNIIPALIFANISFMIVLNRGIISPQLKIFFLMLFQRVYRELNLVDWEKSIYTFLLKFNKLAKFQEHSISNSHFVACIMHRETKALGLMIEYLDRERELILSEGVNGAKPWLNTFYIAKNQLESHPSIEMLNNYIRLFEAVVGNEIASQMRALYTGSASDLKKRLIRELVMLGETRYHEDLAREVRDPLVTADILVRESVKEQDHTAFLLSMILKADWTLSSEEMLLSVKGVAYPILQKYKNTSVLPTYEKYSKHVLEMNSLERSDEFLWFAVGGDRIYTSSLCGMSFSPIKLLGKWNLAEMKGWLKYLSDHLKFDTIKERYGQIEQYAIEDQEEDENRIRQALTFASVDVRPEGRKVVIKDVELAEFPPNLLLDNDGQFISLKCPIVNVLSSEFFWGLVERRELLSHDFISSYWNPIEDHNPELSIMHDKLENYLSTNSIHIQTKQFPDSPLSADINIICSHGRRGAGELPTLSTGDIFITDVDRVIGDGRIAVLFVCHAGASYQAILQHKIMSFVRRLFKKGYLAVIAPFWALHISIPPIWLPVFLEKMKTGNFVVDAMFEANRAVYDKNKNPGAWACLHLYGDPYLRTVANSG